MSLTATQYHNLHLELSNDPQHYGYGAISNQDQLASLLNEVNSSTLTTALTNGETGVISLAVQALPFAVPGSSTMQLISGISSQQITTGAAGAAAAATTVPTVSFTASAAFPIGTAVYQEPVSATTVSSAQLQNAVVASDFTALTAAQQNLWAIIVQEAISRPLDLTLTGIRAQILAIFGSGTTTRANLAALQTRAGSRAEALFGPGTFLTSTDISTALVS